MRPLPAAALLPAHCFGDDGNNTKSARVRGVKEGKGQTGSPPLADLDDNCTGNFGRRPSHQAMPAGESLLKVAITTVVNGVSSTEVVKS